MKKSFCFWSFGLLAALLLSGCRQRPMEVIADPVEVVLPTPEPIPEVEELGLLGYLDENYPVTGVDFGLYGDLDTGLYLLFIPQDEEWDLRFQSQMFLDEYNEYYLLIMEVAEQLLEALPEQRPLQPIQGIYWQPLAVQLGRISLTDPSQPTPPADPIQLPPPAVPDPSPTLPEPDEILPEPLQAYTIESLRLRTGPSTDEEVIQVLPPRTALTITRKRGAWYFVSALGREGWVHGDYVALGEPPQALIQLPPGEFPEVLSHAVSSYADSAPARAANVELAASKINGLVLQPGESYSFTQLVAPVSIGAGYQVAAVFSGGQLSQGIGGGICQVASTIYYAHLRAGILATERHAHSRAVGYVPLGLDATMWEGSLDHRFTNALDVPIQLLVQAAAGTLTVEIRSVAGALGADTFEPHTILTSTSGNRETWATYLRTYRDGELIAEQYLHTSTYVMY